ncbi:cell volume regulation protein A [Nocardioides albertanoniae]|uniref:Cell volume regulation protein A n=1 Tax=Nocardioides albertanoniae TaxID=1175486 RepID=A0A543ADT0_9ACTN|nr:potassium/proton antiporter [Nocardioides albertanoniae]TQL70745.1 cell volume regulation protein A [Nocardioides albertanoniae]
MSFDVHQLDLFVLVGSMVTLLAILAVRVSTKAGLPSLLIYLLMGVLLGDSVLGIRFDDAALAHALGFAALALILAEGGLTTTWNDVRPAFKLGLTLATLGVVVSIGIVAVGAHYLLGLPWQLAFLLGAVTSPTDAAAVFSVLRVVPLPKRLTGVLEAESGLNDAPTVVIVTLIASGAIGEHHPAVVLGIVVGELLLGIVVGLAVGFGGAWMMRRAALPSAGLYPLAVMALAFLAYGGASWLHGSAFAAIYVAALVLGNTDLPHRGATRSFAEGVAWLAQIGLFVMLGLLLSPGRIDLGTVGLALAAGLILTLVARPASVLVSTLVSRMSWRESAFVSWAGLRGAVPVVLTTIPLAEGVDGAQDLFDLVFVMVVAYTLLTGPTLPWVARVLEVARPNDPRALDLDVAPLEQIAADLIQLRIPRESRMHGVEVGELRLPRGASVSLLIRDGETRVPEPTTVLRARDVILVVVPRDLREQAERRLEVVSRKGRLAGWLR